MQDYELDTLLFNIHPTQAFMTSLKNFGINIFFSPLQTGHVLAHKLDTCYKFDICGHVVVAMTMPILLSQPFMVVNNS